MKGIKFDNSKSIDIIPMGRVGVDLNPIEIHRTLDKVQTFSKNLGGSPANIAIGMARLNKKVGFVGRVPDDQFGTYILDYFKEEGIDISGIAIDKSGAKLGLAFVEIKSPTESSIVMYRSGVADLNLHIDDIDEEYIKQSKILLVTGTGLSKSPSREATFLAVEYARKNGVVVVFDLDYREYSWESEVETGLYYTMMAEKSDIIMGSREEFDFMEKYSGDLNRSDKEIAERWFSESSEIIVIKHGGEGSYGFIKDEGCYKVNVVPVKLLKSFGGGDAYGSAFLYGLLENLDVAKSLELGTSAAAMLVSSHSCGDAMPQISDIEKFIEEKKAEHGEIVFKI